LHADHGVALLSSTGVAGFAGSGRVSGVVLADGSIKPADTVVIGVGAVPNVAWLLGSGVDVRLGVLTDEHGATSIPGIVAVGDCAQSYDPARGEAVRNEHWTNALQQPARAARTLLAMAPAAGSRGLLPCFWSHQYGALIQFAGHRRDGDRVRIIEGDAAQRSFVAVYERSGDPTAVLAMNQPRPFTRLRRSLAQRLPLVVGSARHIELANNEVP
jgi:NADPH-dependent 2,4-dienoyl-CoA reductase/sulfur reductase-like enzyme